MRQSLSFSFAALVALSFASAPALGAQSPSGAAPRTVAVAAAGVDEDVSIMLATINAERLSSGLAPLILDSRLCRVATGFAAKMAQEHFFSHESPEGDTPQSRLDSAHVNFRYAGENIALDRDVDSASEALWRSEHHRENILDQHYVRVGIGAIETLHGEIFVEEFSD